MKSLKRRIAALYRAYPLVFFSIFFFKGQFLQSAFDFFWIITAVFSLVLLFFNNKTFSFFCISLLGSLSYIAATGSMFIPDLEAGRSYLVQVKETPRRWRVGEVVLTFEILRLQKDEDILYYRPTAYKITCRGKDLAWENESRLDIGDLAFIRANFKEIPAIRNPFGYSQTLLRRGIRQQCKLLYVSRPLSGGYNPINKLRQSIIQEVEQILGQGEKAGIFLSMTIGARDRLSTSTEKAFKTTGLAHLLIVSGYQISIIYYSWFTLLKNLLRRSRYIYLFCRVSVVAAIAGFIASFIYASLTGFDMSALRAFCAVLLFVVAKMFERSGGVVNSLLFAFLIMHVTSPLCIFEPGVQLTFAALIGLAFGGKGEGSLANLQACIYASFFTSVVGYFWFSYFSLIGLLLNPLFGSIISFLSCNLGFLAIVLLLLGIDSQGLLLRLIAVLLDYFKNFVIWCG